MNGVAKQLPSLLHFEPHSVEGGLQQIDVVVVGGDDEVAIGPVGVLVSADQQFQCEAFVV